MKHDQFEAVYLRILAKAQRIVKEYQDKYTELLSACNAASFRKEYARGGLGFGLGYYCVNPMQDRVIGGVHRGRLLKRINATTKPDWEYFFNKDDILIAARENFSIYQVMHFILRDIDEYTWDISFRTDGSFEKLSVTYFNNNRIELELSFSTYSFGNENEILPHVMYDAWLFEYLDDDLIEFEWFSDFLYPQKAKRYLEEYHLDFRLVRHVYKKHPISTNDEIKYDLYECDESTGECRFFMTQTIKSI